MLNRWSALTFLATLVMISASGSGDIMFSEYGGGQQIWIPVDEFTARSADGGTLDFILDPDANDPLSGFAYYFPYPNALPGNDVSPPENQRDYWVQYEVPSAIIPQHFNVSGTWYFFARTQMPPGEWFNEAIESDWLLVNGHPSDLSRSLPQENDWWTAALAANGSDDTIVNNLAPGGAVRPAWKWVGASATESNGRAKTLAIIDDKLTFRLYEREAYQLNARIDVMVFTSSPSYVPTDADYLSFCPNPTAFAAQPIAPDTLTKPQETMEFTITGTQVGALDAVALVQPPNETWKDKDHSDHSVSQTTIPGTILEVVSESEIRVAFDLFDKPVGIYNLTGVRTAPCAVIEDAIGVFELQLPVGNNLLANASFETGDFTSWTSYGELQVVPSLTGVPAPVEGSFFAGLAHNGDENPALNISGGIEQSVGLPFGPAEYKLVLVAPIRLHDVLYDPTYVTARLLVDGTEQASRTLSLTGWIDLEDLGYYPLTIDWKGVALQDITVTFDFVADGHEGWEGYKWGVAALDDVRLIPAVSICNDPFADADGDGDVDQADFGILQTCITGENGASIPEDPAYCTCFDRQETAPGGGLLPPDGDIDATDVMTFEKCATGPGLPANPGCD